MTRALLASLVVLALGACNQEDTGPIQVENTTTTTNTSTETTTTTGTSTNTNTNSTLPATPKGTVSGQVLKSNFAPLEGAKVDLTVGSALSTTTTSTAADGSFAFREVPAGSTVLLTISATGYPTVRTTALIPASAGADPLDDANDSIGAVVLAELDGRLTFRVNGPSGLPATGARARMSVTQAAYALLDGQELSSRVVVEATVDGTGLLAFTGVPKPTTPFLSANYTLAIEPLDANMDGIPESAPLLTTYTAGQLISLGSLPIVRLDFPQAPAAAFAIDSSNVASMVGADLDPLRNMVRVGDPVRITFNHPVQNGSVEVKLTDEFGKDKLDATVAVTGGGSTVTITPASNTVRLGQEYNLYLRAVSAQTGATVTRTGFFFAGDRATPQPVTITRAEFLDRASDIAVTRTDGQLDPGEVVYVFFNQAVQVRNQPNLNVEAFFDADVDGNGSVGGTTLGELTNTTNRGFQVSGSEPTGPNYTTTAVRPQFPLTNSGYTTRLAFSYAGARALDPASTQVFLKFTLLSFRNVDPYETMWASPITQDFGSMMTALPTSTVVQ